MPRISVTLSDEASVALHRLASVERRKVSAMAALLLEASLAPSGRSGGRGADERDPSAADGVPGSASEATGSGSGVVSRLIEGRR